MLRIFIAEDHAIVRRGMVSLLDEQEAWTVCGEADNGRDAIAAIDTLRPDVVVLDYQLPPPSGLDITKHVVRHLPRCQILVYTMHEEEDLIREILEAGARGFLLKSDPDTELIAAIRSLSHHHPYFSGHVSETLLASFLFQRPANGTHLTSRELQVIRMIAQGHSNKGIATALDVSVKTVESHRASAMRKTSARSTADLTRYAIRNKMVEP
jgi:DNA-binding NarL/FixJ family response regulator